MEPLVITSTSEVRIGDTVRRTDAFEAGYSTTRTLAGVSEICDTMVLNEHGAVMSFGGGSVFEVIERTAPNPMEGAPDSLWREPWTDSLWRRGVSDGTPFIQVSGAKVHCGYLVTDMDADVLSRLVPVDPEPIEGASPWLWDETTQTTWVATAPGWLIVTHRQIAGKAILGGQLVRGDVTDEQLAARLIPYADRVR